MLTRPLLVMVLLLTGCVAVRPALSSAAVAASLSASRLPVSDVRVFTAADDPNKLLGRPNQYIGKVSWKDLREPDDDATIEVFPDTATLKARTTYTETISKSAGMFAQYIVPNEQRLALMRLPHRLTPDDAEAYKAWFAAL